METRLNRGYRIEHRFVGDTLHFVEYISNINGVQIFAIAVSATNRYRKTPFDRSFF